MKTVTFIFVITLAIAGALIAANSPIQQNRPAELLLGSALHQEEVDGDLEAAIKTYRKVLEEYSDDRPVAARALLQIGQCYEKLGKDEARKAYQQLISDYADQSEQAELARVRLAALSKTLDADQKPVFTTRQVLAGFIPGIDEGSLSPDGRYLSFMDQTEELAVRDLETGVIRRLTNIGGGGNLMSSRWSPDGKYIAFVWDNWGPEELRVISAEGGKSRILFDAGIADVFDWSPDSKKILIWRGKDITPQIVLVSASDGATTVLKTIPKTIPKTFEGYRVLPQAARFSRDGQYIAYDWPQGNGVQERDIFVISTDGKREFPLVQHPADDRLLGWLPNGEAILFTSNRHGSLDMWLQTVSGGKAQGLPALVKRGVDQIRPLVFTHDGAFYYQLRLQGLDVYSARIDFRSGKVLAPPEVIITRNEGRNSWPDYSADGKYLAYLTTQSRQNFDFNTLCIRSLESGKEREFITRFKLLTGTQWAPDGQSLYLSVRDDQGTGIYRVNAQTGEFTLIVRNNLPPWRNSSCPKVTPDGKTIIYLHSQMGRAIPLHIIARNLITGEEKQLYSGWSPKFSISPDGQWLALISGYPRKGLQVLSLSGGWVKDLLQFEDYSGSPPAAIEWTPDGKHIIFKRSNFEEDGGPLTLWQIAVDGGEPQKLDVPMGAYQGLSAHPDGQHLVFSSFSSELNTTTGIWVMENFSPPKPSASRPDASASK